MNMFYKLIDDYAFLFIIPVLILIFLLTRCLIITFHEIGHAIPAMIFTKRDVNVFIGSYGDIQSSKRVKFNNRLEFFFTLNPLKWRKGLVRYASDDLATFKNLIVLVMGPIFSLLIGIITFWIVFTFDLNGFLKLVTIIFFSSALIDLRNIYPNNTAIELFDGSFSYNDGQQIKRLISFKNEQKNLSKALKFYAEKNYKAATTLFSSMKPDVAANILDVIITTYSKNGNYMEGKKIYVSFINSSKVSVLNSNNYCNIGVIESNLGEQ